MSVQTVSSLLDISTSGLTATAQVFRSPSIWPNTNVRYGLAATNGWSAGNFSVSLAELHITSPSFGQDELSRVDNERYHHGQGQRDTSGANQLDHQSRGDRRASRRLQCVVFGSLIGVSYGNMGGSGHCRGGCADLGRASMSILQLVIYGDDCNRPREADKILSIISFLGTLALAASMAEMASMYPTVSKSLTHQQTLW